MPLLVVLLLLYWQDGTAADSTISGTVADALTGAALSKVQVLAEPVNHRTAPFGTVTDEKGRFTLVHLPPGEYRLRGARNGYLPTYYGARQAGSNGITLSVDAGGEQKDLKLKLFPFAVIAGTVRDPEGEALVEARVALIAVTYRNGIRQLRATGDYATTDDLGQFRIPSVRPGHYYLKAAEETHGLAPVDRSPQDGPAPQTLVPTFYPAAREPGAARRIDVAAGDRFTGADVTLLRSRLYRVRVKLEGPAGMPKGVGLYPRTDLGDGFGPNPASHCEKGVCEFARVPNGSYSAVGSTGPDNPTMKEMFSNSSQTYVSVPVDVAGADVDGVVVSIGAPAEIDGHITGDRENVRVEFLDADGSEHNARFAADGSFTASLSQGRYEVWVSAGSGDSVATAIRSEDTDVLRDGLTVTRSGKLPLEITMSHDGARIDGVVHDQEDQPVAGATVVLIPEPKLRFRHDLYQEANTDQLGRYHLAPVTPGEYKLFVWPDIEEGIWFDPDFLKNAESQGLAVTVDAKGRAVANLKLPAEK